MNESRSVYILMIVCACLAIRSQVVSGQERPPNDDFTNATPLIQNSGSVFGTNVNATAEAGEPAHAGAGPYASAWWSFVPCTNGTMNIDTHGSDFDTVLAMYTGSSVTALTEVASNDDDGSASHNSGLWVINVERNRYADKERLT